MERDQQRDHRRVMPAAAGWPGDPAHGRFPAKETALCFKAACAAEIFNSDLGSQFTSAEWISAVQAAGMRVSHDGRGRALDNRMVERLWRTVKYEDIYLRDYSDLPEARMGLGHTCGFTTENGRIKGLIIGRPGRC